MLEIEEQGLGTDSESFRHPRTGLMVGDEGINNTIIDVVEIEIRCGALVVEAVRVGCPKRRPQTQHDRFEILSRSSQLSRYSM